MLSIAIAGKPNTGKSTFFKSATMVDVAIASYPFTTIDANHGISHVRKKCPCKELGVNCNNCINGNRFIPIEFIDVAGLVPDAHLGRGLGNEFLDQLRQAQAIIHVVDSSGGTDEEGNPVEVGTHDPVEDVRFLEREMTMWLFGILKRNWSKLARKIESTRIEQVFAEQLMGAGADETRIKEALHNVSLGDKPASWSEEDLLCISDEIRKATKPIIIAANKFDIAPKENIQKLLSLEGYMVVPTSSEAELILRMGEKSGLIKYVPGDADFEIIGKPSPAQKECLDRVRSLLKQYGSTGVQECVNSTVFKLLDMIVAYPVEDENKFSDKDGIVLPDAFLMKKGDTAHDMAYQVHTDLGKSFLYAVDARTKLRLSEKHILEDGDIVKIVSSK
jgi:ribosome-binding ATPase YchF (GTP1/OBG family)